MLLRCGLHQKRENSFTYLMKLPYFIAVITLCVNTFFQCDAVSILKLNDFNETFFLLASKLSFGLKEKQFILDQNNTDRE